MSWKTPPVTGEKGNGSSGVQHWKRPAFQICPLSLMVPCPLSLVESGHGCLRGKSHSAGAAPSSAGTRQLVWHSVSLDEPMLGLVKAEGAEVNEYTKQALDPGLYWQFQAWCEAVQAFAGHSSIKTPSWSVFWRMWSGKWSHVLRFRKRSQHTECNECHQFRESIQGKRKPPAEKMALACKWREHLRAQYHDRLIYWSLRWASRASMDVLTIILEWISARQAGLSINFTASLLVENLERPRVVLSAVLCHGWCSNVFLSDDSLHHGASSTCELLCRSIDRVMQISERTGRPFPSCRASRQYHCAEQEFSCATVLGALGVGGQVLDLHYEFPDSRTHMRTSITIFPCSCPLFCVPTVLSCQKIWPS